MDVRSEVVTTVVGSTVVAVVMAVVVVVVVVVMVVVVVVVVGRRVVVKRVVVGALLRSRRMFLFTSLNQPGTSMRQQYTLWSFSLVLMMVKETSPLWILPRSWYFGDLLETTFVPSV